MKKMISFITGATMGALVGATLALLFAPESGENLRSQIHERVEVLKGDLSQAAAARKAELETQLANLRKPKATTSEKA